MADTQKPAKPQTPKKERAPRTRITLASRIEKLTKRMAFHRAKLDVLNQKRQSLINEQRKAAEAALAEVAQYESPGQATS